MPTEITAAGYTDLRERIEASWTHVGFFNGATELFRLPLTDGRVQWESDAAANPLVLRADLDGDDAEIDVAENGAMTIDGTRLFKVAEAGDALSSDDHAAFTFGDPGDTCIFRHEVQGPEIVE